MKHLLFIAAFAAFSVAQGATTADPLQVENTETLSAKVIAVDAAKRMVTLEANGRTATMEVAPEVRNLENVKAGDRVVVNYHESLAAEIHKAGEQHASDVKAASVGARRPEGMKPGAAVGSTVNSTVVIQSVNREAQTVTFTNEEGTTHTVAVKKPEAQKFIAGLKKGDQVDISYTQALAVSVEPSP